MKKVLISIFTIVLLTLSVFVLSASAEDSISYTDAVGDPENEGMPADVVKSIDITSLSMDKDGDTITFEISVDGLINYNSDSYFYFYYIFLDQDGDGSESTIITISMGTAMFQGDYGSMFGFGIPLTGNGTDTLSVELTGTSIDIAAHPIQDIYGFTEASDASSGWTEDYINEDFGYEDPVDDDDDDPVDDDDDPVDDDDDPLDDDDDWTGWDDDDDEMIPDPMKETPTDESITVTIDNAEMSYEKGDENYEVKQEIDGTTTGSVHHCALTIVTYYKDGTYDADDWSVGPEDNTSSLMGATFEAHFYGIGPGGQSDWSVWEFYLYIKVPNSLMDMVPGQIEDVDDENVSSVVLFVRAYSDEDETLWNQDSLDITDDLMKALGEDNGDDKKKTPGPGITTVMIAVSLVLIAAMIFRRRRR